jgi:hypothetical protein
VKSNLPPIDRFLSYLSTYGTYENNLPDDWNIPTEDSFCSGMLYKCFENWCKYRGWDTVLKLTGFGKCFSKLHNVNIILKKKKNSGMSYTINFFELMTYLKEQKRFDEDIF